MNNERKRLTNKIVKPVVAKKRTEKVTLKTKPMVEDPIIEDPIIEEKKSSEKYVKIATGSKEFSAVGDRIQKGELKWSYYSEENDKGYHFYLETNKSINK